MIRRIAFAVMLLPLASCGLRPMYAGGSGGAVASSLRSIQVQTIPGKGGWMVRNALIAKLGGDANGTAA